MASSTPPGHGLDAADVLAIAALLGEATSPLLDTHSRRRLLVTRLASLLRATAGHWAWGRGTPENPGIAPIGIIDSGYSDAHRQGLMSGSLLPEADVMTRKPIMGRILRDKQAACLRGDVVDDVTWKASGMYGFFAPAGMSEWVQGVRYVRSDTWFNLFYFRDEADGVFGSREREIINVIITHAACLQVAGTEHLPAAAFAGLTPRQRSVMLLLLDGLPRKQVAATLQISVETINDHAKALFKHFGVRSVTELSARFLQNV